MAAPSDVAKKEEAASSSKAVPPVGAKLVRSTTLRIASVYRDSRALAGASSRATATLRCEGRTSRLTRSGKDRASSGENGRGGSGLRSGRPAW